MSIFKEFFYGFICKISPVKRNRVVFTSLSGQYSDSPKAISIQLHEMNPSFEIVWLVKQGIIGELPDYITPVVIGSWKAQWYRGSARVMVDNVFADHATTIYGDDSYAKLRAKIYLFLHNKKRQLRITTWHGTPIKRMGRDQIGNHVTDFLCNDMTMILGDQYTMDIMKRLTFHRIPMELIGTARNDVLFDQTYAAAIKQKIGIQADKKVILFAPTFRSDGQDNEVRNVQLSGINQLQEICFDALFAALQHKFGGEWVFVCRFHYHVADEVDWVELEQKYPGKFINGNQLQDMADYLACSDVLLTDASSCMFDFSLTKKPCFLYFPDLERYENSERGFYIPIRSLPFPIAITQDQLIDHIKNFDPVSYETALLKMKQEFLFVDDGHASEKIVQYIIEKVNGG